MIIIRLVPLFFVVCARVCVCWRAFLCCCRVRGKCRALFLGFFLFLIPPILGFRRVSSRRLQSLRDLHRLEPLRCAPDKIVAGVRDDPRKENRGEGEIDEEEEEEEEEEEGSDSRS